MRVMLERDGADLQKRVNLRTPRCGPQSLCGLLPGAVPRKLWGGPYSIPEASVWDGSVDKLNTEAQFLPLTATNSWCCQIYILEQCVKGPAFLLRGILQSVHAVSLCWHPVCAHVGVESRATASKQAFKGVLPPRCSGLSQLPGCRQLTCHTA